MLLTLPLVVLGYESTGSGTTTKTAEAATGSIGSTEPTEESMEEKTVSTASTRLLMMLLFGQQDQKLELLLGPELLALLLLVLVLDLLLGIRSTVVGAGGSTASAGYFTTVFSGAGRS